MLLFTVTALIFNGKVCIDMTWSGWGVLGAYDLIKISVMSSHQISTEVLFTSQTEDVTACTSKINRRLTFQGRMEGF